MVPLEYGQDFQELHWYRHVGDRTALCPAMIRNGYCRPSRSRGTATRQTSELRGRAGDGKTPEERAAEVEAPAEQLTNAIPCIQRRSYRFRVLVNRLGECEVLDGLVEAVRLGKSQALVVCGEPGVGKTALLEYLVGRASACRVIRIAGVQSEMELAFAGLHQLCAPLLGRDEALPGPQREALRTAFGLGAGPAPDQFLVGLAALGLLAEEARERALVCVVDDAQWLDRASAQALAFVARRLVAESVGLVFAARGSEHVADLAGLTQLEVTGLPHTEARALLGSVLRGRLDERVLDRVVAETRGNPLALLELPRGLTAAELAGGFAPPASTLASQIEDSYRRQSAALPLDTRRLLLVAAAEPVGDPVLVWWAAGALGIGIEAAAAANEA